jgi:hypothetical protein
MYRHSPLTEMYMGDILASLPKLMARFPLQQPRCRRCDNGVPQLNFTGHNNPNGNAGRPFYLCPACDDPLVWGSGWISWNDQVGMHPSNPNCDCGIPSRQGKAGQNSRRSGWGFWSCASGGCDYYSHLRSGRNEQEAAAANEDYRNPMLWFVPWLL